MRNETVIAVFDNVAHAEKAIAELISAGVPRSSIDSHAKADAAATRTDNDVHEHRGFWAWLTGSDTTHEHHALYDQTVERGATVVSVVTDGSNIDSIYDVLERNGAIDLDERHETYNREGYYGSAPVAAAPARDTNRQEESLTLSEEQLRVGKREVDRGTTRVRRYVVERPVEEQIRLRNEKVNVFRRPIDVAKVAPDAFTNKEIRMRETAEEAVVDKTARAYEEVVVQKGSEDRVETVRDTLRREEVEIDTQRAGDRTGATTGYTDNTTANKRV